ncbi:MAG: tetratricopeptide repeat protein [Planctomycetota bacterium]|jgi:tetratricopeptide (TPR) repeat protein
MANIIDKIAPRHIHLLACIIIAGTGLVIYSNTIHSSFHFDDDQNTVDNPLIRDLRNIPQFFQDNGHSLPSRGLVTTTFALNHYFSGLSVEGYHWANISLHLMNGMLVYFLAVIILTNYFSRTRDGPVTTANVLALFVALLFVTASTQTHSVTYIFQRNGLMASFFYLLSLILFIKSVSGAYVRLYPYAGSALSLLCATWCKEMAFSAPVIMFLYYQFFVASDWRSPGRGLKLILPFVILSTVSFYISMPLSEAHDTARWGRWEHLLTQSNVLIEYVKLMLLPLPSRLNVDYDVTLSKSLWELHTLMSSVSVIAILIAAFLYIGNTGKRGRLLVFSVLWFFVILAPTSSLIRLRDIMVLRRLYLPSLGFYLLLVLAVHQVFCYLRENKGLEVRRLWMAEILLLAGIVMFYGVCTYEYNKVWRTEITLWTDAVNKSPCKIRPHYNLGHAYQKEGMEPRALEQYLACKSIYASEDKIRDWNELEIYGRTCNNLGIIYAYARLYDAAIDSFKEAVTIIPGSAPVHHNLGKAYLGAGRIKAAESELKRAIEINARYSPAYDGLGQVYESKGMLDEALCAYTTAAKTGPENASAYLNVGQLWLNHRKNPTKALYWLREAQKRCTNQNMLERVNKIVDTIKEQALSADNPETTE